jgi:hypothetical protein
MLLHLGTASFADSRPLMTASNGALSGTRHLCEQTARCGVHYNEFGVDISKP